MKIRNSKALNLFYASLGLFVVLVIVGKSLENFNSENSFLSFYIFFCLFFGAISIFFFKKAFDKRPIYEIDDEKIVISKGNLIYYFKDLRYYKHERLGSRFGSFDYLFFYNSDRKLVFKICISATDHSADRVIKKVNRKLDEY